MDQMIALIVLSRWLVSGCGIVEVSISLHLKTYTVHEEAAVPKHCTL